MLYDKIQLKGFQKVKFFVFVKYLFILTLLLSFLIHGGAYASYYIATHKKVEEEDDIIKDTRELKDIDIDIQEIPQELLSPNVKSNPAPVEKQEWVEGKSNNGKEPTNEDINLNAISGDGTDKDGYLFSFNGDKTPSPVVDFDLRAYFPEEAKKANITEQTVIVLIQIDETGKVMNAKIVSGRAGHGFDEAALKIANRLRFKPGLHKGKPTKMAHRMPISFSLEE